MRIEQERSETREERERDAPRVVDRSLAAAANHNLMQSKLPTENRRKNKNSTTVTKPGFGVTESGRREEGQESSKKEGSREAEEATEENQKKWKTQGDHGWRGSATDDVKTKTKDKKSRKRGQNERSQRGLVLLKN
jgi:hypothetical protein